MDLYTARRVNMVESQVRANRVTNNRVQQALLDIPRELFVPKAKRSVAYVDEDLSIGRGRYLTEPMVLGRLIQAADVKETDLVLVVGAGTGYSAAVMSKLGSAVVALESEAEFREAAQETINDLGIGNIVLVDGPLNAGWADQAPYNVILIDGAIPELPPALVEQLAPDGRIVTVVREGAGYGAGTRFQRAEGGAVSPLPIFDAATPLLPGFARSEGFVF